MLLAAVPRLFFPDVELITPNPQARGADQPKADPPRSLE
jgi:hypothetical protein